MDRAELMAKMEAIQWWHRIPLTDGIITPGMCHHGADDEDYATNRFDLPLSLEGKTVLDIGAWDGYFSFEAERRGARFVLATDIPVVETVGPADGHGSVGNWTGTAGFQFAKRVLNSRVEYMKASVYDLPEVLAKLGTLAPAKFDYVFFFGVLYHLKEPLLALEKVYAVTNEVALIETACETGDQPALIFDQGRESDTTNFFYPTYRGLEAMLRYVGFRSVELVCDAVSGRMTVQAMKNASAGVSSTAKRRQPCPKVQLSEADFARIDQLLEEGRTEELQKSC
jgi:tRNA (mo5U34)-methyltransferase